MSPTEYVWVMNFVLSALRHAEGQEASPSLKALRAAFMRAASEVNFQRVQDPAGPGAQPGISFSEGDEEFLLPSVDPTFLMLPKQSLQAIEDQAEGLKETMKVFFYFDNTFKSIYRSILQRAPADIQSGKEGGRTPVEPESSEKPSGEKNK
jgi:hypothetical protein